MKRILFLVLWIIPLLGSQSQAAIEIFVDGHKYTSFQAYLASEETPIIKKSLPPAAKKKEISDTTLHKYYVLSIENGLVGALQDFYQNNGRLAALTPRMITSQQLQEAIQEAVLTSNAPKFLISTPGKVRILTLTSKEKLD